MCNFFSFIGDGKQWLYFDWKRRQDVIKGKIAVESADSHTSIATHFDITPEEENNYGRYEYNPLTKVFAIDRTLNRATDEAAHVWVSKLDFKNVIKPLIIKPIINPLLLPARKITKADIANLKKWASVWASAWASVGDSVRASVGDSVWDSVRASVWASVWASVGASVWASVGDSVRASVWASAWVYISSFFNIKYKYDFSPCVKLWERGFVPSFDGKTWRLHQGEKAAIVYERQF